MKHPANATGGFFGLVFARGSWWALAVLLAGLLLTALVARHEKLDTDAEAKREFGFVCGEVQLKIEERLRAHEQILRGGVAFFANNNGVTRAEWRDFAEHQKISQSLPGILGLGFAKVIPRGQLAQHIREIRAEGFPDYRVWPEGDRETCSAIVYLEPFSRRNLRAFGYDMLSESVRRAALERARDQDEITLTGKVTLVQETAKDVQAGTLLFAPVYRTGMPSATVAERRAALLGWVYSPYRMNDLMRGILGRWDAADQRRIHLKIFDGESASPEALLFDSQPGADNNPSPTVRLVLEIAIDAAGRRWLLSFFRPGGVDYSKVWLVSAAGTALSLLLAGLVLSLVSTRVRTRRIAEQLTRELTATRDRLQKIIDSASEYIWEIDADGTFTYVSPQAADVLGRPVSQLLGLKMFDLLPQEDRVVLPGFFKEQAEKLEPFENLRHKVLRPDGSLIHQKITGQPIVGEDGKVRGFVGMAMDITEEEKTRAQLAHDRERIETFFEVAIDLLCIFDLDSKFVRVSRAWEDLTGQSRKALEGSRLMDNVHPDDLQSTQEEFVQVLTGKPLVGFVNRYRSGAGEWRSIEWRAKLIRGNVFAAARDVTEAKAAERALARALARERQTTEIKSRLVSMASHEFRTPLATIRLATDLLFFHRDKLDEAGIQKALQNIMDTADFMTAIVTDVLDLSSLENSVSPEAFSEIDPVEFARQITGEFAAVTQSVHPISFESSGTPVRLNLISFLLKRALLNLLENAAKYSPEGSPVVVRVLCGKETVTIEVEDCGIGVPKEAATKILEAFFRASNTVGIPGTGLGLAIVSEAIARLGGKLEQRNRAAGAGSIFSIHLPVS